MLAYYVRWHMERTWASLTFRDEEAHQERDPVAAAERSTAAKVKAQTNSVADGLGVVTWRELPQPVCVRSLAERPAPSVLIASRLSVVAAMQRDIRAALSTSTRMGQVHRFEQGEHGDFIRKALDEARRELLDLSLRNNFLNYRTLRARGLEVASDNAPRIAELIGNSSRAIRFISRAEADKKLTLHLAKREFAREASNQAAAAELVTGRSIDLRLGLNDHILIADCSDDELDRRLANTSKLARSMVEEQGVNTLFLALGALYWKESDSSNRFLRAPLYLVPASLEKANVDHDYELRYEGEDFQGNQTLQERLKADSVNIGLPEDGVELQAYLDSVAAAVSRKPEWRVDPTHVSVGFFSFTRYLMYLDLDLDSWPEPERIRQHPVVGGLLGQGFDSEPDVLHGDVRLDEQPEYERVQHVLEADSSQSEVVIQALASRALVVQGPPGTGKSQTIANILAEAIARGKRVLFVAEKMAALEVVKRRLDQVGLGAATLELHSNKANRAVVVNELRRTVELGRPIVDADSTEPARLHQLRARLNSYSDALHSPLGNTGRTPFQLYGVLEAGKDVEVLDPQGLGLKIDVGVDPSFVERILDVAKRFEAWSISHGSISQHPFRLVRLTSVVPSVERRLPEMVTRAARAIESLSDLESHSVATALRYPTGDIEQLDDLIEASSDALEVLGKASALNLADSAWLYESEGIRAAAICAARARQKQLDLEGVFHDEALRRTVSNPESTLEMYRRLTHRTDILYRWFNRDYRQALADARSMLASDVRYRHAELLDAMRGLVSFAEDVRQFLGHAGAWKKVAPKQRDIDEAGGVADGVLAVLDYLGQNAEAESLDRLVTLAAPGREQLSDYLAQLRAASTEVSAALSELVSELSLSEPPGDFEEWSQLLAGWQTTYRHIDEVAAFNRIRQEESELGTTALSDGLASGAISGDRLSSRLWLGIASAWLDEAFAQRPELANFAFDEHDDSVEAFKTLDSRSLVGNRCRIALQHFRSVPRLNGLGQAGVLLAEFNKRRSHLPIRSLMERAGNVIQAIKPVFMMSPLSVAVYIPRGVVDFDLVVFDEASQVRPSDALGALLRGKSAIVVGDDKQLPPTSFFDTFLSDDASSEESDTGASLSDMESILGVFAARGAKELMLKWHYRSRHESLIAVSNQEFYEHRLLLFPSPDQDRASAGIHFHHLPNTAYDRGRSRVNRIEAKVVAEAVIDHVRRSPHLSLGVATFSSSQADAIEAELDTLTRGTDDMTRFDQNHPFERFFVKNLETVQGDERDVILISVGYGKDSEGRLYYNFGPLNQEGGHRRLNVLITRARIRTEVFSNFTDEDMDPTRLNSPGMQALRTYLSYARTGVLDAPSIGVRDDESPFEDQVFQELRNRGYVVHRQVGQAGYFIDMAVADPKRPGKMVLGIECDGAAYHSSRSARERDRLRQTVLEGLGWRLHRVWSTDWFRNRESCIARMEDAISDALASARQAQPRSEGTVSSGATTAANAPSVTREQANPRTSVPTGLSIRNYVPASLGVLSRRSSFHELHPSRVAEWLQAVVNAEAPVQLDLAAKRVTLAYGINRMGGRVKGTINSAVMYGIARGLFQVIEEKTLVPAVFDLDGVVPRDRSELGREERHFDYVPGVEVDAAILMLCAASHGLSEDEVASATAQLLGFGRASAAIREAIERRVVGLAATGKIERVNIGGDVILNLGTVTGGK